MKQDKDKKIECLSGESFYATCSISNIELEAYKKISKIKNMLLEDKRKITISKRIKK
jgi:hypothetical protein